MKRNGNQISLLGRIHRPLSAADMPAIVLTHNDMHLLGAFLEHYRGIGVTRFLCVDDASNDGTREFLLSQDDVDVYGSNCRYSEAHRGRLWREMLVERYGRNRWYLSVDSDEFLVYSDITTRNLKQLTQDLQRAGILHMPAPMLDMYPPGLVSKSTYEYTPGHMPWHVANLLDSEGYVLTGDERTWTLKGGVRRRCFDISAHLMKYPLAFWGGVSSLSKSIHYMSPYWRNFHSPSGAILHFQFFSNYFENFSKKIESKQHFNGSQVYTQLVDRIQNPNTLQLESSRSIEYTGSSALVERGFIDPVITNRNS